MNSNSNGCKNASDQSTGVKNEMSDKTIMVMKKKKLFISTADFCLLHNVKQSTARKYLAKIRKETGIPPKKPVPLKTYCRYYDFDVEDVETYF